MNSRRINNTLTQQSSSKGESRAFEIYNDKFVRVTTHSLFGHRNYHLNLSMLEPWPIHQRRISWQWFASLIYFACATLIFSMYLYQHQDQQTLTRLLPFIISFVLLTLGSLILFIYNSPNVIEFRSRYGGCVLLSLLHNKPDRKRFRAFVAELRTRILAASQAVTFDKKQMLTIELKELQRLANDGALKASDYERARDRITSISF